MRLRVSTYERLMKVHRVLIAIGKSSSMSDTIEYLLSLTPLTDIDANKPLRHLIIDYAIVTSKSLSEVEKELKEVCGSLENQECVRKHIITKLT